MSWDLKNKFTLITGGSKGIGKAIVEEFLEMGASVLFIARNQDDIDALLSSRPNAKIYALSGDLSDVIFRKAIYQWIKENWGKLDVLVNNAGMNIRKPSTEYTEEELEYLMNINLYVPFFLSRELYSLLINGRNPAPAIINISSVAGIMDAQTGAPYGMSKSAVLQLTRSLAAEWAHKNIRVNAVSPWFTRTPATKGVLANSEKLERIVSRTPARRVAMDKEIAAAVAFLAMDKASFITGQNIIVDGGATISLL